MAREKIKTILSKEQEDFLNLFSEEKTLIKRFYLTGGTALAEFYLKHRYSEDLDFFNEEEFSLLPLQAFVKKAEKYLRAEKVEYQNFLGLHTFLFYLKENGKLKVDFNFYPFPRILKGLNFKHVIIDSDYDIAVNKVHTLFMKPRSRDYVDLYFIMRAYNYSLDKLILDAKAKFDWDIDRVTLASQFTRVKDFKDMPVMLKPFNRKKMEDFFLALAKQLENKIFKD